MIMGAIWLFLQPEGPFCGCPQNKSATIWLGSLTLETPICAMNVVRH